jgi:hypothetical protein
MFCKSSCIIKVSFNLKFRCSYELRSSFTTWKRGKLSENQFWIQIYKMWIQRPAAICWIFTDVFELRIITGTLNAKFVVYKTGIIFLFTLQSLNKIHIPIEWTCNLDDDKNIIKKLFNITLLGIDYFVILLIRGFKRLHWTLLWYYKEFTS